MNEINEIKIVNENVKGRGRYGIPGLKRSTPFRYALEATLANLGCFTYVSASAGTGRLLVEYPPGFPRPKIREIIAAAVTEIRENGIPGSPRQREAPGEVTCSPPWHAGPSDAVLTHFQSDPVSGISPLKVPALQAKYGENLLPLATARSDWQIISGQINSLPNYLLGAAACISLVTGSILDAAVIVGVAAANAAIGYVTESRAEKNIDALNDLVRHTAEVIRDGTPFCIAAENVVPGDLLLLKPGVRVPADCRLTRTSGLTVDESMLTGENLPITKHAGPLPAETTQTADRKNMAYMGTFITGGQGTAVVVGTGLNTEIGRLKILLDSTVTPRTPIERQLEQMGNQLVVMCMVVCAGVFGLGLFMGYGVLNMLRMSISLAAAAVPEGLPAAATVNFAGGINRMRKDHIIVRRLQAIETLGAVQTICLDKTGTLTRNEMAAAALYVGNRRLRVMDRTLTDGDRAVSPADSLELTRLLQTCVLCTETGAGSGDGKELTDTSGSATESALTSLAQAAGMDLIATRESFPLLRISHRSEKRQFMSTLHRTGEDEALLLVKGSPMELLHRSEAVMTDSEIRPMTREIINAVTRANETMAGEGQRVLGFAARQVKGDREGELEHDLVWLGLVGMTDPPREGIRELIAQFHRAGVRTVMLTGDQEISARRIAGDLDLAGGEALTSMDAATLDTYTDEQLADAAGHTHVYARVTPSQKLRIITAIRDSGRVVAMTGDGINDGPALKAADIGIAMGRSGTGLARDVADVVLEKDNLELMAAALADGRSTHRNIKKSVRFFLSTNFSEIQFMTTAMAVGLNTPLNVMQLLWINLISDILPGLALSGDPPESDVMDQPPRQADMPLISGRDFWSMMSEAGLITGSAMAALVYGIARYGTGLRAGGLAFQTLTLGQLLHTYTCRSETAGIFTRRKLPGNTGLNWAVGGSLALQMLTMVFPPLRSFLGLSPISGSDALVVGATSLAPGMVNEIRKAARERKKQERP